MAAYATVAEYRLDADDSTTAEDRIAATLEQQSAKLRETLRISESRPMTADQRTLARMLVTDAARKSLVKPAIDGLGDVAGVTQASFTANSFQGSYTMSNPSGSAYFDRNNLAALRRSLFGSQRIGTVMPSYGKAER